MSEFVPYIDDPRDISTPFGIIGPDSLIGFEEGLWLLLNGNLDVNSQVGNRIYPNYMPQSATMPAIVYQIINTNRMYTMTGQVDMPEKRVQLECWAESYSEADQLCDHVRKLLSDYTGTVNNLQIDAIFIEDESDLLTLVAGKDRLRRSARRLDIRAWYREQV